MDDIAQYIEMIGEALVAIAKKARKAKPTQPPAPKPPQEYKNSPHRRQYMRDLMRRKRAAAKAEQARTGTQ